ncbi:uncharacterized protein LOC141587744 [Silene latifolia]|uniref:uncharacterized protein LOC141587744 n=1 Tax=Silene latifolia TaxID=37657 RepID=UPI003D7894E3
MCMVWNIQGAGSKNKINALKEVVQTYKPTVLALLETHKDGSHAENVCKILGYKGHSRVDAIGYNGSIWLYWHPNIVTVQPVAHHSQFITIEVTRCEDPPWFFSAVYASPNPHNRHELWAELECYAHSHNHPWMIAGDFNETRTIQERHGGDQNMRWNKEVFGNIFRKKRELMARIEGCQRILSVQRATNLIKLEVKLRRELDEVLEREKLLWYQKSRVDFIHDGDRNTSYFHVSTLVRRWKNRINALKNDEGEWVENCDEVKSLIVEYYKKLYTEEENGEAIADIPYDIFQEFSNEHWDWLNRYYSHAEIERAIFDMGSLKASGPDGFQALFYQKH